MMKHLLFLFVVYASSAQILHHQTLAAQGKTVSTPKGFFVSQSVGQQSISGSAKFGNYIVQQGFQQSMFSQYNLNLPAAAIAVKVYPNPFNSIINFDFASEIKGEVEIGLFDDLGRLVYSTKGIPQQDHLTITPSANLAEGHYILSLVYNDSKYSTQLIKSNK